MITTMAGVEDIIEIIPEKELSSNDSDGESEGFEFNEDEEFDHEDNGVEQIVDALGGLFVSSEGNTISDILAKISDILDRQVEVLEKQNKVLFRLAKVIEESN